MRVATAACTADSPRPRPPPAPASGSPARQHIVCRGSAVERAFEDSGCSPRAPPMRDNQRVSNPDRLSGLDASFLALEEGGAHMHVGSVLLFEGKAPPYEEFVAQLERRLALVPRYRQKLAFPPLVQSRPVWIDDPYFNAGYHVRHTALPAPAGEHELRRLAGRAVRPAAGPLQAAVGALAGRPRRRRPLRADLQDASLPGRRHLGRRHHGGAVRPRRRPARAAGAASPGCRARSRRRPRCSPTRWSSAPATPLGLARAAAARASAIRRARSPRARRRSAGWPR